MNEQTRRKLTIADVLALSMLALAYSPKTDEEKELQEWADASLSSIPQKYFDELYADKLVDEDSKPTKAGMRLVLNGTSFMPNFALLAKKGFSTAMAMLLRSYEALQEFVEKTETKQILPGKNEDMIDQLISLRNWIDEVTSQYRAETTQVETKTKAKAKK